MNNVIKPYFLAQQRRINKVLEQQLPSLNKQPKHLPKAMRYAVLNGGKRLRPLLVYATGKIFNAKPDLLDHAACAVEFVHCYSLVHDDLPAMDNDDLRRGKLTCHRAFDEATAILAGDALQTLAFKILADSFYSGLSAPIVLEMIKTLADACGSNGMAGGQVIDLRAEGHKLNLSELKRLHELKTGALISASIKLGALIGGASPKQLEALAKFSRYIGLAFQIKDDILDIETPTETLGKQQGADLLLHKATFPSLLGMDKAKKYLIKTYQRAIECLQPFGKRADLLQGLANYIVERDH